MRSQTRRTEQGTQSQFFPLCTPKSCRWTFPDTVRTEVSSEKLKVIRFFCFLTHHLLSSLVCQALPQGSGISLLLHVVPSDLHWAEKLCASIKHYLCIILITHKLVSCICSYSWFLSHLFYNNNFKSNVLKKEMNKHKTCKRGKLMWDFRQVIYLPFWLSAIL